MSEQKVKVETEWIRSEPVDRTKRVAPGGDISTKNMIKGTRSRKNVNYDENKVVASDRQRTNVRTAKSSSKNVLEVRNESTIAALTNKTKGLTLKAKIDENTPVRRKRTANKTTKQEETDEGEQETEQQEDQQETEQQEEVDERDEDYQKFLQEKDIESDEEEFEPTEEKDVEDQLNNSAVMEDDTDAVDQLEEEAKSWEKTHNQEVLPLIRDTKRREAEAKLSPTVVKEIQRLGGKIPATITPNKYRKNTYYMPAPFNYLANTDFQGRKFKSNKYDLTSMEICVIDLAEWSEYPFLKDNADAIIVGEGEVILAAKQRPAENVDQSDFDVWIISEEDETEGPHKFSAILKSFEEDDTVEDDEEEEGDDE
jgi:hypothetical protein